MTCVSIVPEPTDEGLTFRAIAGTRQSVGKTAGEALDGLNNLLPEADSGTLVVVQNLRPDRFFTEAQQHRLAELMEKWRSARDRNSVLPAHDQAELDALADAELQAAADRAAAIVHDLSR